MPHKKGPNTYQGYQSPNAKGWPEPIRREVRHVYGAWRVKNPGEDPKIKARGSRIAWSTAKQKYPKLYDQHIRDQRRLKIGARTEKKEHPWASQKTAQRIAGDHIAKDPNAYAFQKKSKKTIRSRRTGKRNFKKSQRTDYEIQAARIAAIKE